jgi:hypothetical protein
MLDFGELETCELLTVGRRALEMGARRFDEIARAADPSDGPLRDVLRKMSLDAELQAAAVEEHENVMPEEARLSCKPEDGLRLIRGYLISLRKGFGEGPLNRDVALFLAESLQEEMLRLCRVLAGHAREWGVGRVFSDLAEREQVNSRYLREVVLQG